MVTPVKQAHLRNNPWVSCNHWDGAERYDTCVAECKAELLVDDESCAAGWELLESTPPLGYDPASVMPEWQDPTSPAWGVLRMVPWRVKVFPGVFARTGGAEGEILTWQDDSV